MWCTFQEVVCTCSSLYVGKQTGGQTIRKEDVTVCVVVGLTVEFIASSTHN